MSRDIIINHAAHETRVSILENGTLKEIHHDRKKEARIVGNIYKGRISKVLPGMGSAFVDIGVERAAFLYIDDFLEKRERGDKNGNGEKWEKPTIDAVLKEGDEVLVQISKGPIGTKGARITTHVSLPGRNLVYMPHSTTLGVSRQISNDQERTRLKHLVDEIRPENAGFIVRTVAEGCTEEDIRSDINYLLSLWDEIKKQDENLEAPALLYEDLNITFRTIRDQFSGDIRRLMVDSKSEYQKINHFVRSYLPRYRSLVEHFSKNVPIFDQYGVEAEIDRALEEKVWLPSGGSLVINQTEALTAIDVNTGRFVGKESHEKTILRTNLEAAEEVVYQLQLRNIGGIIIIDFIDMDTSQNRQKVYQNLKDHLKHDKTRTRILQISEMGLVEMTRKRDRENLRRYLCSPCPYCDGDGRIKSSSTVTYEVFREITRNCRKKGQGSIVVFVHPDVFQYVQVEESSALQELEQEVSQPITFKSSSELHHEQFELYEY